MEQIKLEVIPAFENAKPTIQFGPKGAVRGTDNTQSICGKCAGVITTGLHPRHFANMVPGKPVVIECPHCSSLLRVPKGGN